MEQTSEKLPVNSARATYLYWGSAYFVAVAVLYLWGYWSAFGINILEYVGLSDIAKTAAYPVASTFVVFFIGVIAGEVFFPHKMFPPGGGENTSIGRTLNRFGSAMLLIYVLAITCLFLIGPSNKWRVLPFLLAPPVTFMLKRAGLLSGVLPSDSVRTTTLFLLATLPPFSYGHGKIKALELRDGKSFSYLVSPIEGVTLPTTDVAMSSPRYIGLGGDHVFFYEPISGAVLLTTSDHAKIIRLKAYAPAPIFSSVEPASAPSSVASRP